MTKTLSLKASQQFDEELTLEEQKRFEFMMDSETFTKLAVKRMYHVGLNNLWVFVEPGKTPKSVNILFFERGWWQSVAAE